MLNINMLILITMGILPSIGSEVASTRCYNKAYATVYETHCTSGVCVLEQHFNKSGEAEREMHETGCGNTSKTEECAAVTAMASGSVVCSNVAIDANYTKTRCCCKGYLCNAGPVPKPSPPVHKCHYMQTLPYGGLAPHYTHQPLGACDSHTGACSLFGLVNSIDNTVTWESAGCFDHHNLWYDGNDTCHESIALIEQTCPAAQTFTHGDFTCVTYHIGSGAEICGGKDKDRVKKCKQRKNVYCCCNGTMCNDIQPIAVPATDFVDCYSDHFTYTELPLNLQLDLENARVEKGTYCKEIVRKNTWYSNVRYEVNIHAANSKDCPEGEGLYPNEATDGYLEVIIERCCKGHLCNAFW